MLNLIQYQRTRMPGVDHFPDLAEYRYVNRLFRKHEQYLIMNVVLGAKGGGGRKTIVYSYHTGSIFLLLSSWGNGYAVEMPWTQAWQREIGYRGFDRDPEPKQIAFLTELGFRQGEDGLLYHQDGWYSKGQLAFRFNDCPWPRVLCDPEAESWYIREGILITFPDKKYRLCTPAEYLNFLPKCAYTHHNGNLNFLIVTALAEDDNGVVARQGDFLILRMLGDPPVAWRYYEKQPLIQAVTDFQLFGERHYISGEVAIPEEPRTIYARNFVLRHPEHEEISDSSGAWREIVIIPGTSRPFSRANGAD